MTLSEDPNENYVWFRVNSDRDAKRFAIELKKEYGINATAETYGKGKVGAVPAVKFSYGEMVSEAKTPTKPVRQNRWLAMKNDESMHANKKLSVGLKELKYQLREVEKFLGWYGKLKNINELDSDTYWKRTNNNIKNIKERIINIARKLQEIEK